MGAQAKGALEKDSRVASEEYTSESTCMGTIWFVPNEMLSHTYFSTSKIHACPPPASSRVAATIRKMARMSKETGVTLKAMYALSFVCLMPRPRQSG